MKIGVTGANGFIGTHLLAYLLKDGHAPVALVRDPARMTVPAVETLQIPTIDANIDIEALQTALSGLDAVVHLAASVHDMSGTVAEEAFRSINVTGTVRLFEAAIAAGVQRFVFMSSAKAAGERSDGRPLSAGTAPGPEDAYGRSKRDAETALQRLAAGQACQLVILRPTFVYGWPPVGNFSTLLKAVLKGLPLPLAAIRNRRDLTYVGNIADAACRACSAPGLGDTPYFICDGAAVSTPELIRNVALAFARPARLIYMPVWLLRLCGKVSGRSAMIERLTEDFEVESAPFHRDAGWQPPYNMAEGLRACAAAWQNDRLGGA